MNIQIEVPGPKHNAGDFVRITERGADAVVRVESVDLRGDWSYDGREACVHAVVSRLITTVQSGTSSKGTPMRPGTCLVIPADAGERVDYNGTVTSADTHENIDGRLAAWGCK